MGLLYTKGPKIFFRDSRKELYLYLILWLLLFLTPVFSICVRLSHGDSTSTTFPWHELLLVWRQYAVFLAMFLVHNFLLAPLLVYRQHRKLYFSSLAVMLGVFLVVQCVSRPLEHPGPRGHHDHPSFVERPPHGDGERRPHGDADRPPHGDAERPPHGDAERPPHGDDGRFAPPPAPGNETSDRRGPRFHEPRPGDMPHPPIIFGEHDVAAIIIFVLMLGMNVGVKLYFRQQKDRDRLMKLEHENLEQQLEYLKYQINPHFLMNTLNNIHALVDINPEEAKETIVELSKIMRFVLYEGNKQKVPLRQELIFLQNYIGLMKMRYSEQVTISVTLPDILPDHDIPPLLLITFVENAFKHGVSYQQPSFIKIDISLDKGENGKEYLIFRCANSKVPKNEDSHGGVGLQNARRRLELLYATDYTLNIANTDNIYTVELTLPL